MKPRSSLILVFAGAVLFVSSCTDRTATDPLHASESGAPVEGEHSELPLVTLEELPLRFPAPAGEATGTADDLRHQPAEAPGLIETLRGTVEASPVFEEAGADDALVESLDAAQAELARTKRENRRAIREANRQLRVGSTKASPHLVLVTLSDVAYADIGCYGGETATPRLDEFAAQGMRFSSFYASGTDPRGARWSLLTGLNGGRAPGDRDQQPLFELAATSQQGVIEVLWMAGYSTAFVGVWRESGPPLQYGCDEWTGIFASSRELDPFPEHLFLDQTKARLLPNADGQSGLPIAEFLFDEAISTLARRTREGRPCFVHLAISPELMPPPDALGMLPDAAGLRLKELDSGIGRFLIRLNELGLSSHACVVIAGESTPAFSNAEPGLTSRTGPFRTSSDGLAEGNLRVPLLVRWPGRIKEGVVSEHVCATWDLLPTLADLAGAQRRPVQLDGLSFAPELLGQPQREHALLYWETREQGFGQAVRKGDWKGVRAPRSNSLKLYDLRIDPAEQVDVSHEHPDVVEQLRARGR